MMVELEYISTPARTMPKMEITNHSWCHDNSSMASKMSGTNQSWYHNNPSTTSTSRMPKMSATYSPWYHENSSTASILSTTNHWNGESRGPMGNYGLDES